MDLLYAGIVCRWWQNVDPLPDDEVPLRLNERNLQWHQNYYDRPDPLEPMLPGVYRPFYERTPYISTTAGTIERDALQQRNVLIPAWLQALYFATDCFQQDEGYLYYCHVFVLSKKAIGHRSFAEELRELNIYSGYSPFQPEGEITAKIIIPSAQIERLEHWSLTQIIADLNAGIVPQPNLVAYNPLYLPVEDYSNIRELLA